MNNLTRMFRMFALIALVLITALGLVLPTTNSRAEGGIDATKRYLVDHATEMLKHVTTIQADAQAYFNILKSAGFDYQKAWVGNKAKIVDLVSNARKEFITAHNNYERMEGIVAGVPSLANFDTWIDAGPLGSVDPKNAYDWSLKLDDGRVLDKPGNIFHYLLETTLWGTTPEHTGLRIDLDGNGKDERGDALPEAYTFLAIGNAFVDATTQMNKAVGAWKPSLEDSFTALTTMIPTMGDYFEEWKDSAAITGKDPRFVAQSRLVDVKGIASSLSVIYANVELMVKTKDSTLNQQIMAGFDDLVKLLDNTYDLEISGKTFTAEEADALGTQAQDKAQKLAVLVGQAATLLDLKLPNAAN